MLQSIPVSRPVAIPAEFIEYHKAIYRNIGQHRLGVRAACCLCNGSFAEGEQYVREQSRTVVMPASGFYYSHVACEHAAADAERWDGLS